MPVKTAYDKNSSERTLEDELARWRNEFSLRNGKFNQADNEDAVGTAVRILDGDWEENKEFIENAKDEFRNLKELEPVMDRFNLLHTTLGNLNEAENLPSNFIDGLVETSVGYIDGFIPTQQIQAPQNIQVGETERSKVKGVYEFYDDRLKVSPTLGNVRNGGSALALASHEIIHKNNVEAVLDKAGQVRDFALIYRNSLPEDYQVRVEESDVAPCNYDILGGLALQEIEEQTGILQSHKEDSRAEINYQDHLWLFSEALDTVEDEYGLTEFDIRDETMAKAVTYFVEGIFEQDFKSEVRNTRTAYNRNEKYSENAGDRVKEHLEEFKQEYESRDGLRGERFKATMKNRIPFLKGNYEFGS